MNRTNLAIVATGIAAATLTGLTVAPALAAPGDTSTTFTLAGNGISVTTPASANLSSSGNTLIGGASTLSGSLGSISVADNRGGLLGSWTASVTSTAFTTGASGASETISAADVAYNPGVPSTTGVGLAVGTPRSGLASSVSVVTATNVTGAQSASWDPTVTVTVAASKVAGTYSGTITHSIA
jgi:hypothetical protein